MTTRASKAQLLRFRTALGRWGKMPPLKKRFKRELGYIIPGDLLLMPIAHMLLHGLLKDLYVYALVLDIEPDKLVQFSVEQRRAVKVRDQQ